MPRLPMTRDLQQVAMADQVRLNVGHRIFEAVADAGLRPEVNDTVDVDRVGECLQRIGIREIQTLEPEAIAELLLQLGEPRLLETRIIIVVQTVDPDDVVAALEQCPRRRSADEPRSTCDQNSHGVVSYGLQSGAQWPYRRVHEAQLDV